MTIWIVFGLWLIRRVLAWFLYTRRIEKRMEQMESLLRALAGGMGVELPPPVEPVTLRGWVRRCNARVRALTRGSRG
ncbi:hypothetical protein [Burkholderia pseudomallei]|uniref:hypothetical protein n=1 Tax=Burkholderia pseudomallei TaxID=28450 RepID=UPI000A1A0D4A|nr:hypothetical protein [Burkholderia pseudomallei]ARL04361.1 hypothetical protein BOC44_21595 [Burkholderia pseudomallei]